MKIKSFVLSLALAKQGEECVIKVPIGSVLLSVTEINTVPVAYFRINEKGTEDTKFVFKLVQTNYDAPENSEYLSSMRCSFTEWHVFLIHEPPTREENMTRPEVDADPEPILEQKTEENVVEEADTEPEMPTEQAETPPEINVEGATSEATPVKRKSLHQKRNRGAG